MDETSTNMTSFQYMSDLHLEMFPGFRLRPQDVRAPFLILAGDIGDPSKHEYKDFLTSCACLYERVFVVLGNHEAYGKESWSSAVEMARQTVLDVDAAVCAKCASEKQKVVLLANDAFDIPVKDGLILRVLGCTLWSDVVDDERSLVGWTMADYRKIGQFSIDASVDLHRRDVKWLENELIRAKQDGNVASCVVITHHAPMVKGTSHPKYLGAGTNSAFATDLVERLIRPYEDVAPVWIHGHTHYSHVTPVPGCTRAMVYSNQRGYANLAEETRGFCADVSPLQL